MKLYLIVIYTLCICLSFMSSPCTSYYQANDEHGDKAVKHTMHMMPRKLKVIEPLFHKLDVASPGRNEIDANKRKQDELDEAEYFTMDYKPRKKRPPVHNKSQPSSIASSP